MTIAKAPAKPDFREGSREGAVEGQGLIKSIDKAVSILHALYAAHRPLRVSELAKTLSLSPSVVSRIVSTLSKSGLLEQDEESGRIYLGLGLVLLGSASLGRRRLDYVALPVIAHLSEQFEEYVSLSRLVGGKVVMFRGGPLESLQRDTFMNVVLPVHATAPGKLLCAWLSESELDDIIATHGLDPYSPNTITTREQLREELTRIRKDGFAFDNEEIMRGLTHIATPIFDHDGRVVAALSAGGPAEKMAADGERLKGALTAASVQISRQLGHRVGAPTA
ncbi:MAG: IclR family transcriptional regulator [Hyphomonadaceae bacterium]